MKKLCIALIALALCGCAHVSVEKTVTTSGTNGLPVTTTTAFSGYSFLANSALKTVNVDSTTKTTTNLLKANGATTEPNPEAITASTTGFGTILGEAIKAASK